MIGNEMRYALLFVAALAGGLASPASDTPSETLAVPVVVTAKAERAVFKSGEPLLLSVTITNGLSKPIRFSTFATKPNNWNGETSNISLIDVYRNAEKRNLYFARPQIKTPDNISGMSGVTIEPGKNFRVVVDIGKWLIDGGWKEGKYELAIMVANVHVDDKITMSILSNPVQITVQSAADRTVGENKDAKASKSSADEPFRRINAEVLKILKAKYPDAELRPTAIGKAFSRNMREFVVYRLDKGGDWQKNAAKEQCPDRGGLSVQYFVLKGKWEGALLIPPVGVTSRTVDFHVFKELALIGNSADGNWHICAHIKTPAIDSPEDVVRKLADLFADFEKYN